MASFLSGKLAKELDKGFKKEAQKGLLRRDILAPSGGLDEEGDALAPDFLTWACRGFISEYSDTFKARASIPMTDLKVCIFAASLPSGTRPDKDDTFRLDAGQGENSGQWFQLRKASTDPATALWVCQAFRIKAKST